MRKCEKKTRNPNKDNKKRVATHLNLREMNK